MNEQPKILGIVIDPKEKEKLKELALKYSLQFEESLFEDNLPHSLWGLCENRLALLGTEVMRRLPKIIHGTEQLSRYLWAREFEKILLENGFKLDYSKAGQTSVSFVSRKEE